MSLCSCPYCVPTDKNGDEIEMDNLDELERKSLDAPMPWGTVVRDLVRRLRDVRGQLERLKASDAETRANARVQAERERVLQACKAWGAAALEAALRADFATRKP